MRNYIFYSIVVVSFLFHACDGVSKDYNELNKDNLAGTYKVTSFEVSGIETQTNNGSEEQTTFDIEGSNFEEVRIIFTESGRAITRGSHTLTIVSTKDGVTQTEVEQTMITIDDDYTLDGDQIKLASYNGLGITVRNFSEMGMDLFLEISEGDTVNNLVASGTYRLERE